MPLLPILSEIRFIQPSAPKKITMLLFKFYFELLNHLIKAHFVFIKWTSFNMKCLVCLEMEPKVIDEINFIKSMEYDRMPFNVSDVIVAAAVFFFHIQRKSAHYNRVTLSVLQIYLTLDVNLRNVRHEWDVYSRLVFFFLFCHLHSARRHSSIIWMWLKINLNILIGFYIHFQRHYTHTHTHTDECYLSERAAAVVVAVCTWEFSPQLFFFFYFVFLLIKINKKKKEIWKDIALQPRSCEK